MYVNVNINNVKIPGHILYVGLDRAVGQFKGWAIASINAGNGSHGRCVLLSFVRYLIVIQNSDDKLFSFKSCSLQVRAKDC